MNQSPKRRSAKLTGYEVLPAGLTVEQIRAQVRRIQAAPGFASAPTLRQLLEFTVERTLSGESSGIKESTLAIEVFGRKPSFDPQLDPIVRVQARKLRDRLAAWYETGGAEDGVIIEYVRGSYVPRFAVRPPGPHRQRVIAVLPFANLSGDSSLDYLCDGITEEIRYLLNRIHGLRIVAHTSAQTFRSSTEDAQHVGALLHCDLLVRGTVRLYGVTIRITAELIGVEDGFQIWSERWQRPVSDLFRLQDEIAATIAGALRSHIAPDVSHSAPIDAEAHQLFMKGRFLWNQRTEHGLHRAIEYYNEALEREPDFARAYAALAETYISIAAHHIESAPSCLENARAAAAQAAALDANLAAAHNALAITLLVYDRRDDDALREWHTALELDPDYAYGWHGFGLFGAFAWPNTGRAVDAMEKAQRLEPLSPAIACDLAIVHYVEGRYEEAIRQASSALDLHPSFARTYVFLARAQAAAGFLEDAVETCLRGRPLFVGRAFLGQLLATLGYCYGRLNQREGALGVLAELGHMAERHFVAQIDRALIHAGIGERDRARELLQRAVDEREFWSFAIATDPLLGSIR